MIGTRFKNSQNQNFKLYKNRGCASISMIGICSSIRDNTVCCCTLPIFDFHCKVSKGRQTDTVEG